MRAHVKTVNNLGKPGHQNIIKIFAYGWMPRTASIYFIDMERCAYNLDQYIQGQGVSLKSSCQVGEKATFSNACGTFTEILQQVTNGLAYIHNHGYVHGDLKPSNGTFCG